MIYKDGYEKYLPEPDLEEIKSIFQLILKWINEDFELSGDLLALDSDIDFVLTDCDFIIKIEAEETPARVSFPQRPDEAPLQVLSSKKDFHLYWCHQINLLKAITSGKIKFKGPVNKILGLGQVVDGTRKIYLKQFGRIR